MLDLPTLRQLKLARVPKGQVVTAAILSADYRWPRRTRIHLEGIENIPADRSVFLAMNHTDRYNYWPFQYAMYKRGMRYTATWVKGKYYENPAVAWFMLHTNNIPVPSRGYVISTEFRQEAGRPPQEAEYRYLRGIVDSGEATALPEDASVALREIIDGAGGVAAWLARFEALFGEMMRELMRLHHEALFELDQNVLVFPQGTRSIRLSRGHTGMAQVSQHLGVDIVPVGCNGSDRLYPGNSPLSQGGEVVYRVGEALRYDGPELAELRVPREVVPFTREAEAHQEKHAEITALVMNRINGLLDPEYRYSDDASSDGVEGMKRFL